MAGHAQLKFVMTECSKTQIRLTGLTYLLHNSYYAPTTATLHVSAISFQHKIRNIPNRTATFLFSKILESFKRIRSNPDTCMPIMCGNLISICNIMDHVCISNYEIRLFRTAYVYFGIFWLISSELDCVNIAIAT